MNEAPDSKTTERAADANMAAANSPAVSGCVQNEAGIYRAAQIAACLGRTPQAVRKEMRNICPASIQIVAGIEAAAWRLDQLTPDLRDRLSREAKRRNYRNAEAMLAAPPSQWQPAIPLHRICADDIDSAQKLRQALSPWLIQQHSLDLSVAEIETAGAADYARIFGHPITARYWRELFSRSLQRDAGAEDWSRLEIYLPNRVRAKEDLVRSAAVNLCSEFAALGQYISACGDPLAPTTVEERGIWTLALEEYASLIATGTAPKQAARKIRDFLYARAPFLAATRDALLKAFCRKLAKFERGAADPKALRDGREANGQRFELSEDDRDLIIHRAVFYYRGDIAPAWRDCLQSGFSELARQRYSASRRCKSRVPGSVLESVSSEVAILTVMHQGKRAFDSIKGHVTRNYDGVAALKCMSADDFTMPVYFYIPDGNGGFHLTRGQILLFIDFRTLRILGWSMQPDRNYSSLTIRSLCTHVFAEHGIPEVLQFERGIWMSSQLLKGRDPAPFEFTAVVQGLREFGIKFVHSIRPRSKTVERIGGLIQDLMEAEPGYCGRDERRDAPEELRRQMAEVATRKRHPSDFFYSYDQWQARFGEIVDRYNATEQQGNILQNLSPDAALAKHADAEDPPMQLDASVRYLLAHDKRETTVTLDGVKFQIGKRKYNYKGKEISHLVGHRVLVWFDPENAESIVVTDLNRRNPICVSAAVSPGAMECLTNPASPKLARAMQQVEDQASHMKARFVAVKSKYPMPQRRLLASAQATKLGRAIEEQKAEIKQGAKQVTATREKARRMNIPAAMVGDDESSRAGVDLIAEAKREHSRGRASAEARNGGELAEDFQKGTEQ